MKCQILFSEKIRKKYFSVCHLLKTFPRLLGVEYFNQLLPNHKAQTAFRGTRSFKDGHHEHYYCFHIIFPSVCQSLSQFLSHLSSQIA